MDEGLPRPTPRQGGRRPAHPPRPHHRDRQRELALQARTRPQPTTSRTARMTAPRRAPAPPLRLRLRSGTAARHTISYETKDRKPDGGWGHFRRPRRGQCKRPQRALDDGKRSELEQRHRQPRRARSCARTKNRACARARSPDPRRRHGQASKCASAPSARRHSSLAFALVSDRSWQSPPSYRVRA